MEKTLFWLRNRNQILCNLLGYLNLDLQLCHPSMNCMIFEPQAFQEKKHE